MPESNDQIVQQARQHLREQITKCSQRAAQKIAAKLKSGAKPSIASLTEVISSEFEELNR
jgi:homoserine kinase